MWKFGAFKAITSAAARIADIGTGAASGASPKSEGAKAESRADDTGCGIRMIASLIPASGGTIFFCASNFRVGYGTPAVAELVGFYQTVQFTILGRILRTAI